MTSQDDILPIGDTPVTDWAKAKYVSPTLAGWYEVRNCAWMRPVRLVAGFVHGRQMRYWDGIIWRAGWDNSWPSVMGKCVSHEWRGLRAPYAP